MDDEPTTNELCYFTTDPYEIPLVMPPWTRQNPVLAKQLDEGHALRRAAGQPIDGTLPDDWPGYGQQMPPTAALPVELVYE